MNDIRLHVIMPTIGRPTWTRAADSALRQLGHLDMLHVIGDPMGAKEARLATRLHDERYRHSDLRDRGFLNLCIRCPTLPYGGGPGNAQRTWGMARAQELGASHVMFLDDDDGLEQGAVSRIREGLKDRPDLPHFWPLLIPNRKLFLNYGIMQEGGVGGSQIVAPVDKLGTWGARYAGDWDFINSTLDLHGRQWRAHWGDGPLVIIRPWTLVPEGESRLDWTSFPLLDFKEHPLAGRRGFPEKPGELV
jgi:hypothetical protein